MHTSQPHVLYAHNEHYERTTTHNEIYFITVRTRGRKCEDEKENQIKIPFNVRD